MTPKNYLSNKKTSNLNISISPALKDWIQRYVNKKNNESPKDKNYKSTSTFICNIMENVLTIFEKGKTLEDFSRLMDKETEDFYNKYSVNMLGPFVEPNVEFNKYTPVEYGDSITYFSAMRNFFNQNVDPNDLKSLKAFFERIKNCYLKGNLTKNITIDLFYEGGKNNFKGVIEHIGFYRNLHFFNAKMLVAFLGFMGLEITDFNWSMEEVYYRIDFKPTDLYYNKKLAKKERLIKLEANIKHMINFNQIIGEDSRHIWLNLTNDRNLYINFKNFRAFEKWIGLIEKDLQIYGEKEDFLLKILKFFEDIHWINILDKDSLSFQLNLSTEDNKRELEFLLKYLLKYSKICSENECYYIEPF